MSKAQQRARNRGVLQTACDGATLQQALDRIGPWVLAIIDNASELLMDGDALFDAGRYPRAAAMAYFSLEELGKAINLISLMTELAMGLEPDWEMYEKSLVGHSLKLQLLNRAVTMLRKGPDEVSVDDWVEIGYR